MESIEFYGKNFNINPYPFQQKLFELLSDVQSKTLFLLRAPTGSGKTEGVVAPFLAQWLNSNKFSLAPRLIYVLPTRGLCNQIHDRIEEYATKVDPKIVAGVEHGTNISDPLFFSDICVTTFDQFLYGYARTKPQVGSHVDIPAGSFANSVIVFDEAHLYSPYTHALLRAMLEILCCSKIPVIIMTATMPQTLQEDLMAGLESQTEIVNFSNNFLANRRIKWKMEDWELLNGDSPSPELLKTLQEFNGRRILIVVNRVNVSQKLAKGLKKFKPVLIHSRFSIEDRKKHECEVLKILGKDSAVKEGIVVSTQVCEVGLDISADLLITECASADAIVQRIGRVARWGGIGDVVIVQPDNPAPYLDKKQGKAGNFVNKTWDYLKRVSDLNFTSWEDVKQFCDEMQYRIDTVEARNALGQLFESTLYADSLPYNLSARNDVYCTLFVTEEKGEASLPYGRIKDLFVNVPFRWFRQFWGKEDRKKKGIKVARYYLQEQKLGDFSIDNRPSPFGIYALQKSDNHYDDILGLQPSAEVDEEESCLIF